MATVEKKTVVVEETSVVLTLTLQEARVLKKVLQRTGGNPEGPRGAIEGIEDGLQGIVGYIDDAEFNVNGVIQIDAPSV